MPIRVLIVDDSPIMRGLMSRAFSFDPEIEVVGTATDPLEARHAIKQLDPDVITLDVEMPKMSGLEFLDKIMRLRPMPVVMMSTHTHKGADTALRALELGAVECVGKPQDGNASEVFAELAVAVKAAAMAKVTARETPSRSQVPLDGYEPNGNIIAIGASTGGVEALTQLLQQFPENCPPTIIVQHMPALFTGSFAGRLNRICAPEVLEAQDNAPLKSGRVYISPGGQFHTVVESGTPMKCRLQSGETVTGHRPSVDLMFDSVAKTAGARAVAAILTGMGKDGARGLLNIRKAGGLTFGQDQASSVIYGMPRVAYEMGAVSTQVSLNRMATNLLRACQSSPVRMAR